MSIPAGAEIAIRTNEGIDSRDASESRSYAAQVAREMSRTSTEISGFRGVPRRGCVRNIGDNQVALDLQSVTVNGRRYTIDSDEVVSSGRRGLGENRRTGEFIGGGAALGAVIGAIAGGGKGAGIGALAGGAAGAGAEALTKGDVRVPAESVLNFRLESPVYLHSIG